MVSKTDWQTSEMPEENEKIILERVLSGEEIEMIKEGHRPQEMEDKWFMYYEAGKLYIHRSWTGFCIYIVDISEGGKLEVLVNRNPQQHKEKDVGQDKIRLNFLLNCLIKNNRENATLMKLYIERKNKQ